MAVGGTTGTVDEDIVDGKAEAGTDGAEPISLEGTLAHHIDIRIAVLDDAGALVVVTEAQVVEVGFNAQNDLVKGDSIAGVSGKSAASANKKSA